MDKIPIQKLKHRDENVFFAFRTMEENHALQNSTPSPPHRHDFYTILFVKKACGLHYIDYVKFDMKPRLVFMVSPGQVHQVVVNRDKPEGDIIMFNDEFLYRNYISTDFISNLGLFSSDTGTPPIEFNQAAFEKLCRFSQGIQKAFKSNSELKFDEIAAYLKLFLIECNEHADSIPDNNLQNLQAGRPIVKAFKKLLDVEYPVWHKVSEYSEAMNISPDYLNNVIKSNIGKTAKEMINARIVLEAKRMGIIEALSNKEIAYQLGFNDPSHFSKFFKKETNQSFSDFRKDLE